MTRKRYTVYLMADTDKELKELQRRLKMSDEGVLAVAIANLHGAVCH